MENTKTYGDTNLMIKKYIEENERIFGYSDGFDPKYWDESTRCQIFNEILGPDLRNIHRLPSNVGFDITDYELIYNLLQTFSKYYDNEEINYKDADQQFCNELQVNKEALGSDEHGFHLIQIILENLGYIINYKGYFSICCRLDQKGKDFVAVYEYLIQNDENLNL